MLRCNPLEIAWTGKKANYVSPIGEYGRVGYSELAMHTRAAGQSVVRYALWDRDGDNRVNWAQIELADGRIIDGLPGEVLPDQVRRDLGGFGSEKLPSQRNPTVKLCPQCGYKFVAKNNENTCYVCQGLSTNPKTTSRLSVAAKKALKKIYAFSSVRGFRLGLNSKYAGSAEVVHELISKGMVSYRRKYGYIYLIPSRKGRKE